VGHRPQHNLQLTLLVVGVGLLAPVLASAQQEKAPAHPSRRPGHDRLRIEEGREQVCLADTSAEWP